MLIRHITVEDENSIVYVKRGESVKEESGDYLERFSFPGYKVKVLVETSWIKRFKSTIFHFSYPPGILSSCQKRQSWMKCEQRLRSSAYQQHMYRMWCNSGSDGTTLGNLQNGISTEQSCSAASSALEGVKFGASKQERKRWVKSSSVWWDINFTVTYAFKEAGGQLRSTGWHCGATH